MKTARFAAVLLLGCAQFLSAQPPAAQLPATAGAAALPEIEALRAPYLKNIAALRTARDARASAITRSYITGLERLRGEITARGDLDGALTVKAELERMASNAEPSTDERKAMPPPLVALRTRYEKEREPIFTMTRQQEEQQTRAYLTALEALQRRFTTMNQLEKALTVKAERESYATTAPRGEPVAGPAATSGGAAVATAARLDVPLADKIAAVVRSKSYVKTAGSEPGKPEGGSDVPEEGALLVGFEFMEAKSEGVADVRSLRPFYLMKEGIVPGRDRGQLEKITDKVLARSGYAVAGLTAYHNKARIQGLQIVFMKIDPRTGRLDPNPTETYRSKWFGTRGRGKPVELGGDGRLVIGVFGRSGADADSIGLVQMP